MWKKLDEESLKNFLDEKFKNKEEILYFFKIFNSVTYSQSSGDYMTQEHKKFNYKNIGDFTDYDFIEKIIRELDVGEYSDEIQFSVKMFLNYIDDKLQIDEIE